jgi:hypothetical protein
MTTTTFSRFCLPLRVAKASTEKTARGRRVSGMTKHMAENFLDWLEITGRRGRLSFDRQAAAFVVEYDVPAA